jgi:hypothetical protein
MAVSRGGGGDQGQFHFLLRDALAGRVISRGSVQNRMWRQRGRGYQWTRKVAGKTVTVALTLEQFVKMKEAVANERALQKTIAEIERLSRRIIFESSPHPGRRKSLSDRVLGLN